MFKLKVCLLEAYRIPTESAFQQRKIFHSSVKSATESIEDWFRRTEECISGCDFGDLSDFLLIDKFISGLNDEIFQQFTVHSTLTIKESLSKALAYDLLTNDIKDVKSRPPSSDDFLQLERIKVEQFVEPHVGDLCDQDSINGQELILFEDTSDDDIMASIVKKRKKEASETSALQVKNKTKIHLERIDKDKVTSNQTHDESDAIELKGFEIDDQKRIVCLDCGKCFLSKKSYIRHQRIHTGKDLLGCNICGHFFTTEYSFERHKLNHLHAERSFECYLCSLKFKNSVALKTHLRIQHVGSVKLRRGVFKCTHCEKTFSNHIGLSLHKRIHQNEDIPNLHKCHGCDKVFNQRSVMLLHAVKHSDVRPFVCETCGKCFKSKFCLKKHMIGHTDQLHECKICGKMIKWERTLRRHLRVHAGEYQLKCDLCEKTFAHRNNLRIHLMVHRNERPHVCSVCEKRFVTLYNMKVHMLIHTGERPYKCDKCDKAFTQAATLRSHTSKWH